jgi:hypothetical protein
MDPTNPSSNESAVILDSSNSIIVVADGPIDTTVRPSRFRHKPTKPSEPPTGEQGSSDKGPDPNTP